MPATVRASYFGASATEPAGANAETGIKFNKEDTQTGTTAIPIPSATGTNYSWYKQLALEVTAAASPATTISNRSVYLSGAPTSGLKLWFKAAASYVQATDGNRPADVGTAGPADPAGYTSLSTTPQSYHSTGATGSVGRNGNFCLVLMGVDNSYAGGASASTALPNIIMQYDEA